MNKTTKTSILQNFSVSSRRDRRRAVGFAIALFEKIHRAELESINRVPENFQGCDAFLAAEESFDALCEILDLLPDVYP